MTSSESGIDVTRHPAIRSTLHAGVILITLVLGLAPCLARSEAPQETLEVATYEQAATLQIHQRFIKEAYLRQGITTRYTVLPLLRAAKNANSGETDAMLMASTDVEANARSVVRVPEPLPDHHFRVVARNALPHDALPPDLGSYTVGYLRGIHPLERTFANKSEKLTVNSDFATLIELLILERVDLVALPELDARIVAERNPDVKLLDEPVYAFTTFHYLHQNHRDLAEPLAGAFRILKSDKTCLHRITQTVINNGSRPPDTLLAIVNDPDYQPICTAVQE